MSGPVVLRLPLPGVVVTWFVTGSWNSDGGASRADPVDEALSDLESTGQGPPPAHSPIYFEPVPRKITSRQVGLANWSSLCVRFSGTERLFR